ncbi:RdgB/HAM1 family non-canonical purine NTP pyrophosphatase [Gordonia aquimaris]|uniref:dITP/XTP pyrophosphatase n=1 Tax=Gordonia aquimaris TaxID=2984863 RepID=A0A9X3D444_9ACTN|nr:RdgB/HAM1 family non-canonical purine NTP pyrophosphatase [Gordonia aquimaris]MCX2964069.1 RdgB/HAM1 family non-canonical purine NTP pyrophosphatase [Gordonia aquimaris]
MSTVLVASRNAKKLAELRRVLDGAGITGVDVIGLDAVAEYPEEPETGATFEDNALIKAVAGARATGMTCLADDSGLSVDALNGMPGVLSARWSGRHGDDRANNDLLLAQIGDVPDERRGAAFVSACALVTPSGGQTVVRGEWRGTLLRAPRGDNGFGYDPLFVPDDDVAAGRSSAELSAAEKDSLSHRGKALAQLVPVLRSLAG